MDWGSKLEGLKSAVLSAAIAAGSAYLLGAYAELSGQMKMIVDALAVLAAALWNQFRSQNPPAA